MTIYKKTGSKEQVLELYDWQIDKLSATGDAVQQGTVLCSTFQCLVLSASMNTLKNF